MVAAYYFNHLKQFFIAVFVLLLVSNHLLKFMAPDSKKNVINRFTQRKIETMRVSSQGHEDNGIDHCDLDLVFQLSILSILYLSMVQERASEGLNKVLGKKYCDNFSVSFSFSSFLCMPLLSFSS